MATKERIFFGSLEHKEKERVEEKPKAEPSEPTETLAFSARAVESQEKHKQLLQKLEQNKRARHIAVPTNDGEVQMRLRELREPIILFGEKPEDRRTRLRELLAKLNLPDGLPTIKEHKRRGEEKEEQEAYLTEGVPELKAARLRIAEQSVRRAKERLLSAKRKRENDAADAPPKNFSQYTNASSEIGDERPLTSIAIAPSGKTLATGSWSGLCKLWDVSTSKHKVTLRGHTERVHDISFHPQANISLSPQAVNLATAASDSVVHLWPLASAESTTTLDGISSVTPLSSIKGHTERVNTVAFHPFGNYIATASSDRTWRFWDVNTTTCLLVQEGHSRAVHGLAFQVDGSLVATGGDDAIMRVWDLRSGKTVAIFQGHVKQIVDLDFAPNGYQIATGSDDHTVRVWDLRKRTNVQIIAGHSSLISTVRYQKDGDFLLSASFDKTCKLWNTSDWSPAKVFAGHEGRIMSADISDDSKYIATACYDRTWKLWCDESTHNVM